VRASLALAFFIAVSAMAAAAHAEIGFGASAQTGFNTNLSNAQNAGDKISDEFLSASLSLSQLWFLGSSYLVSASAETSGEYFDHLSGLRNASFDASLSARRKWGLGSLAPWARATLVAGRTGYEDSYRNLTYYRGSLETGKRVTAALNVSAAYLFVHHDGAIAPDEYGEPPTDVFSGNAHSLTLNLEYSALPRLLLNLQVVGRHGDVVSTTHQNAGIYFGSRAAVEDPAFGDEEYAYRMIGTTYGIQAGSHYALGAHHLIGVQFGYFSTHASGNNYINMIPEITWAYRY
jgi:hypothetical protein